MATLTPIPTIPSAATGDTLRPALSRQDLFDGIPRRDLDLLDAKLPLVRWPRDAETPAALTRGDHIYLVRQGRIALYDSPADGPEVMTAVVEPGAVYSSLGLESAPRATALEMSAVTPLPVHAIEALINRYPRFGVNLAVALSGRLINLRETVGIVSEMRVEDRLRRRLHQVAEQIGTAAPEGSPRQSPASGRRDTTHGTRRPPDAVGRNRGPLIPPRRRALFACASAAQHIITPASAPASPAEAQAQDQPAHPGRHRHRRGGGRHRACNAG